MKILPLTQLCKQDYNVKFLSYVNMPQSVNLAPFSCISQPKKQEILRFYPKEKQALRPAFTVYGMIGTFFFASAMMSMNFLT